MHTGCMLRTTVGEPPSWCFGREWQLSFVHPGKGIFFNYAAEFSQEAIARKLHYRSMPWNAPSRCSKAGATANESCRKSGVSSFGPA